MTARIERSVVIRAPRDAVWRALTEIPSMAAWMGEPEMALDIVTDWTVGGPIVIRGAHHEPFENRGTVLRFEPLMSLRYSHKSSLSGLPDVPESFSVFDFALAVVDEGTKLTFTSSGFPTLEIEKHLDAYWRVTLVILQRFVEGGADTEPSTRSPKEAMMDEATMDEASAVAQNYDEGAEREWERLDRRKIEFGVTCLALSERLPPPPARVLDVGGGPGRYALWLAQQGYSVSLVDLSRNCLEIAKREALRAGLELEGTWCANATDLSHVADASFDAVLLLGPLYHLKQSESRLRAVHEARRVLRSGGLLFSAFLNRYSVVRYAAKARPEQFLDEPSLIHSILETGLGDSPRADAAFLCSCYFCDPLEVKPFMDAAGLETVDLVGCEGVVVEVEERLNALAPSELEPWLRLSYSLGRKPELHASAAHLLHVGKRK